MAAWQVWALLYGLNFLFTFIIIAPISRYLEKKIGRSPMVELWGDGFNYTLLHDFIANYEVSILAFVELTLLVSVVYLFFAVFAAGGIFNVFHLADCQRRLRNFWSGSTYYFWRILRVTVYFLMIQAATAALFGFVLFKAAKGFAPDRVESELEIINVAAIVLPIYVFFAVFISIWQLLVKAETVRCDESILLTSFKNASKFLFSNLGKIIFFYLLNLATLATFYMVYRYGSLTFTNMNVVFLFGQILIIGRIGIKLWLAAGTIEMLKGS